MAVRAVFICLLAFVASEITYIEVKYPLKGQHSPPGVPWPIPADYRPSHHLVTADPRRFSLSTPEGACDVLAAAVSRYRRLAFADTARGTFDSSLPSLPGLRVKVFSRECGYPSMRHSEAYNLTIPFNVQMEPAELVADTVWGAIRGLETFSQLVYQNDRHQYRLNATVIRDKPRYAHRGLLLDTSRHFLPMSILRQNLDAMAYNKFNVFHWHIVDDQSWPFQSRTYPNLTQAAYTPKHIYTQEDIKEIIEYARMRAIRVIPEFDTPGHTQAVGSIYPELLTSCYGPNGEADTANYPEHHSREILDPTKNFTYNFFKKLFQEVDEIFPDEYIHLGMDEVYYGCWKSNPNIKKFMDDHGLKTYNQLEAHYVTRTLQNVKDIGYKYIIWQDPVDNDVEAAPDALIQIWKDTSLDSSMKPWQEYIAPVAKKNYRMLVSACYYLNYISYGQDWRKYYECDPTDFPGTQEEKELVVGGEACMWGEYVDGTNIIPRLWPRAAAVAERLWSPASITKDTDSAAFRLDRQRCRMVQRGIPAAPILNGFCGEYDWAVSPAPETSESIPVLVISAAVWAMRIH